MAAYTVEERIAKMRTLVPPRRGLCAMMTRLSLNLPPLGAASATVVAEKTLAAGKLITGGRPEDAPRGAIMLWTGGSKGYGHMCLSLGVVDGVHMVLSTDVMGKMLGEAPTEWIARFWGNLEWAGWTTWYGQDLPMETDYGKETPVSDYYSYSGKPAGQLVVPNTYVRLERSEFTPPVSGPMHTLVYLNLKYTLHDPTVGGKVRIRMVRNKVGNEPADPTAYSDFYLPPGDDNLLVTYAYFEKAQAGRPLHWELKSYRAEVSVGTRYVKYTNV